MCVLCCEIMYVTQNNRNRRKNSKKIRFDELHTLSLYIQPLYNIVSNKKPWITKIDDIIYKNPDYHLLKHSATIMDMQADKLN